MTKIRVCWLDDTIMIKQDCNEPEIFPATQDNLRKLADYVESFDLDCEPSFGAIEYTIN